MTRARLVAGVLLTFALAACSGGGDDPQGARESARQGAQSSSPATTAAPTPPRPDPKVGTCHDLDFAAATEAVDRKKPVRCRTSHTSVTYAVGQLDLLLDGHLLAMDSDAVGTQLRATCDRRLADWIGGTEEQRRLSRFRDVWFRPDVTEADRGASWYRCDVVAVAREGELARFRGDLRGVLDGADALDTWGTCGNKSPARKGFVKVICSEKHSWRAVSVVDLPKKTKYLGRRAARDANTACQDEATSRVNASLRYQWAFQWPTREAWDAGQRYGWCWLPVGG